jgi:hypothetical protein
VCSLSSGSSDCSWRLLRCLPSSLEREEARKLLLNLRLELREIIDSIEKNRKFKMFALPVSPEDAPDYYELVDSPMDLEAIRALRLRRAQHLTLQLHVDRITHL